MHVTILYPSIFIHHFILSLAFSSYSSGSSTRLVEAKYQAMAEQSKLFPSRKLVYPNAQRQ